MCIRDREYSIDNGNAYQSANVFNNLSDGTYQISVRNTSTGCITNYSSTVVLTDPNCGEICNNGIDDDGDGQVDCEDEDCQATTISITPDVTVDCLQEGSGAIDLQIDGGTTPYSYQWEDIARPTAHWDFNNTTNDIGGGNHHQDLSRSLGTPSFSTDAKEGTHAL